MLLTHADRCDLNAAVGRLESILVQWDDWHGDDLCRGAGEALPPPDLDAWYASLREATRIVSGIRRRQAKRREARSRRGSVLTDDVPRHPDPRPCAGCGETISNVWSADAECDNSTDPDFVPY